MIIYLIAFGLSCLLLRISNKIKNSKIVCSLIRLIAILIPCILAGVRATSIGTDVEVYVMKLFECAKNSDSFLKYYNMSWFASWKYKYVSDFEIGFSVLVYLITRITGSIQWILFFIQLIIIVPIYFGLKKYKILENKIWLAMLVYYLMFYNVSLNLMRQFIGIAILFYGASCLINKEKANIKYFLCLFVASLFHKSSLLGIFIYFVYYILNHDYKKNTVIKISKYKISANKFFSLAIIIGSIILVLNSSFILTFLGLFGFDNYNVYVSGSISIAFTKIIKYVPILLIFFIVYKNFIKIYEHSWFYILMFVLGSIIITQFSSVNSYAERMGYIFQIFNLIGFPLLCSSGKKKNTNTFNTVILISYMLFYWYYIFVYNGANETIPYVPFWK